MIKVISTVNDDRNLTSAVTCLTATPSTTEPTRCQAALDLGDGSKNLSGAGGNFELTITVGSQVVQPGPQTIVFGTAVRAKLVSEPFTVPANTQVVVALKSPNGADTDVDVTATLYDLSPQLLGSDDLALISTDAQDLAGTLSVNVGAISASTAAADALEAAIDTTDNVIAANVTQISDAAAAAAALEAALDTTDNVIAANVTQVSDSADAAGSLEIAAARLGNRAIQTIATGTIKVRNLANDADLYTVAITNDGTYITRTVS